MKNQIQNIITNTSNPESQKKRSIKKMNQKSLNAKLEKLKILLTNLIRKINEITVP
jgi:hypothetical protein